MAQIFISHSSADTESITFFSKIFAATKVRAIFEELEKIEIKQITAGKTKTDLTNSNAIFILLDKAIENRKHTRDWIVWECGFGSQNNKDVWLFEKQEDLDKLTVLTPSLKHYVRYNSTDDWFAYIKKIVSSYDDSHILGTTLTTTAIGAALTDKSDRIAGAFLGAISGLALSQANDRPIGIRMKCINCASIYNAHIPEGRFRCPVCNKELIMNYPKVDK